MEGYDGFRFTVLRWDVGRGTSRPYIVEKAFKKRQQTLPEDQNSNSCKSSEAQWQQFLIY